VPSSLPAAERRSTRSCSSGTGGVAFVPDLLVNPPGGAVELVSARYMHDPAEARRSLEKLLDLRFSVLCLDHGVPVLDDPKGAIRALLAAG
jgi:hypothetical protein